MKPYILQRECFISRSKEFFIDLRMASNDKPYIKFTRLNLAGPSNSNKASLIVFQEDMSALTKASGLLFETVLLGKKVLSAAEMVSMLLKNGSNVSRSNALAEDLLKFSGADVFCLRKIIVAIERFCRNNKKANSGALSKMVSEAAFVKSPKSPQLSLFA